MVNNASSGDATANNPSRSFSDVAVMELAETGDGDRLSVLGRLHRPPVRRTSGERHVWSVPIVELRIRTSASQKMTLTKNDHAVRQLAPEGPGHHAGITPDRAGPAGDVALEVAEPCRIVTSRHI